MNKTVLYWVVGAIVVIGGGYLAYAHMNGGSSMAPSSNNQASSGSIASLIARGGSSKCDVSQETNQTSGTVYVGGGKMRGDFTSQTSSGAVTSHMISDGTTVYVWSSAMAQGIKMAASATGSASASGNAQANMYNQSVNYSCVPWSTDASEFQLPAGITFTDMSAMLQGAGAGASASGSAGAGAGANCAMCDQAGTGRDQCRAALHCQ